MYTLATCQSITDCFKHPSEVTWRCGPGLSPITGRSSSPRTSRSSWISGMTDVRTSPYYPQSNGKIERWHKSLKGECIRPGTPLLLEDARRLVECYVELYNKVRMTSALGYISP